MSNAFSISPVTNMPAATGDDGFPKYLQFQEDGENLGGRDADTVDFGTGLVATRGVGENANKVTVTADGGGGEADELLVTGISGFGLFDGSAPTSFSGSSILNPSDDVSWTQDFAELTFNRAGVYAVTIKVMVQPSGEEVIPTGFIWFGAGLSNGELPNVTKHTAFGDGTEDASDRADQCFTDVVYYNASSGSSTPIIVYAESQTNPSASVHFIISLHARFIGAGV